jgi:hypothetical protein
MKHLNLKTLVVSLTLSTGLTAAAYAVDHNDHHPVKATLAKKSEPVPATLPGTWKAIDRKSTELQRTIQSGALGNVHHLAYAVRDLVATLPSLSRSLPVDRQTAVKGSVKFVATLADRLDASGDAHDKAGAADNYEKLMKVLKSLRANYDKRSVRTI